MAKPIYSLIIPVYNEADTLPELCNRVSGLMEQLDGSAEIILVNDGSRDQSYQIMLEIII